MSGLFGRFVNEQCVPVVLTVATAEVEVACQKNGGLMFHELLTLASGAQTSVTPCKMRFERYSEARPKNCRILEQTIERVFMATPLDALSTPEEAPSKVTAWSQDIESVILKSMSFSEVECISAPVAILYAVSMSDYDPIACLHELDSIHHAPHAFKNGQYDPNVLKLFVLVHDASLSPKTDPNIALKFAQIQSTFTPKRSKLVSINAWATGESNSDIPLPSLGPRYPLFFPEHVPLVPPQRTSLAQEDVSSLFKFCVEMHVMDIFPELEKRIDSLSRHVAEHRKGVKNVLRSFWRKPSEGLPRSQSTPDALGQDSVKYRYDSSEGQTLLLADTYFILRDYEVAFATYRLLREDFKADNSVAHFCYILIMMTACQLGIDPKHGGKDFELNLKTFKETAFANPVSGADLSEIATVPICLGMLAASMYSNPVFANLRAPRDAANMMLAIAYYTRHGIVPRKKDAVPFSSSFPLLTPLITERAAQSFALAKITRKYVLYLGSAAQSYRIHVDNEAAQKQALVHFIVITLFCVREGFFTLEMDMLDNILALPVLASAGLQPFILTKLSLLLDVLHRMLPAPLGEPIEARSARGRTAAVAMQSILLYSNLGGIKMHSAWYTCGILKILRSGPPCEIRNDAGVLEVEGLRAPVLDMDSIELLVATNGAADSLADTRSISFRRLHAALQLLDAEVALMSDKTSTRTDNIHQYFALLEELSEEATAEEEENRPKLYVQGQVVHVRMRLTNPFPFELDLSGIRVALKSLAGSGEADVSQAAVAVSLAPYESKSIVVAVMPAIKGSYSVDSVSWCIGGKILTSNSIERRGRLIHKTLKERTARARSVDRSLHFDVIEAQAVLKVSVEGLPTVVNEGEIVDVSIVVVNEGRQAAADIKLKVSNVLATYLMNNTELKPEGPSLSILPFPPGFVLAPNEMIQFRASLFFHKSFLFPAVSKETARPVPFSVLISSGSTAGATRYCGFYSQQLTVVPSLSSKTRAIASPSLNSTLFLSNDISTTSEASYDISGIYCVQPSTALFSPMCSPNSLAAPSAVSRSSPLTQLFKVLMRAPTAPLAAESCWLMPLAPSGTGSSSEIICFLRLLLEWKSMLREYFLQKQALSGDGAGDVAPRTISQVRKDRQMSMLAPKLSAAIAQPENSSDAAYLEETVVRGGFALLCEAWSAENRRGLFTTRVSLGASASKSLRPPFAAVGDAVMCKLVCPSRVELGGAGNAVVSVALELTSYYHDPVAVTVQALDGIGESELVAEGRKEQWVSDGVHWLGKTSHAKTEIAPFSSATLTFALCVTAPGVYDLRRFKIVMASVSGTQKEVVLKQISEPCNMRVV